MNEAAIREAFDDVFDQALVFHGFADYMRDYDVFIYATADPRTGVAPEHLRYRFTHCVKAVVETTVRHDVWTRSHDDVLTDYETWLASGEPEGYVWGVKWSMLYPGMSLLPNSDDAAQWSAALGRPMYSAIIGTNSHNIALVFADLVVSRDEPGASPFQVPSSGPDGKFPLS